MQTVQVNITRPSMPAQHNATISCSYNATTGHNLSSHNRYYNNGGWGAETRRWEEAQAVREIRRPRPLSPTTSDRGDSLLHSYSGSAERDRVQPTVQPPSDLPSDFAYGDREPHNAHDDRHQLPLLNEQYLDDTLASSRHRIPDPHHSERYSPLFHERRPFRSWPQMRAREVTGRLQDSDRLQSPYDYEYIPTPQPRSDQREPRPREPKSRCIPSDWPPDYTAGDRHGTYDDQRQPFSLTQRDRDDTPATSRHRISDSHYPERYNPAFQEPKLFQPWPAQTGTRDSTGCFDHLQDRNRPPPHDSYEYDTSVPQPRFDGGTSVPHPREVRSKRPSDWPSDYDRHGAHNIYDHCQPLSLTQRDRSRHHIADSHYPQRYNPVFQEPKPARPSYNPRFSSERLVETCARVIPYLPTPRDERFEEVEPSRFVEDNPRVVHYSEHPPKYDIPVSDGARSEDRVYMNGFTFQISQAVYHKLAQDKDFESQPTVKLNNPFCNRTYASGRN